MRFDVYGKYELEVVREAGRWLIYQLDGGKRRGFSDVVIPPDLETSQVATWLDDMLHEAAGPGDTVRRID